MKLSIKILSLFLIITTTAYAADTASILPPAKTTFLDSNGKPLTAGTVDMYIPSTTTRKATWQDAAETILNTNPVVLDAAGRALILGSGSYRQVVKDKNGNIIWDQVTSSTGSGGSATTATGDGDLVGTIKPWAGMAAPSQYMLTYGQEISRVTFATLFTAITSSQAVFCNSGSAVLTGFANTTNFPIGAKVEVSCLAAGISTIVSKTSTTLTLAANANLTTNTPSIVFPWGNGNGSTTFNLPDFRGLVPAGNNNMGGVASANLTLTYFGSNPNSIGALGGAQLHNLTANENGPHNHNIFPIDPGHGHVVGPSSLTSVSYTAGGTSTGNLQTITATGVPANQNASTNFTGLTLNSAIDGSGSNNTTAFSGSGLAFSIVQPTKTANYIIKVTPDVNSATASGVTSLGGMTGSIACGGGLLCTGNVITNASTTISADNVIYTAPYSAAVARTQTSVNAQETSVQDFGCVADSGVTDNGPCLRATYDAAAIIGGTVIIPPSSGYYGVSTCRNNAVFDGSSITVPNGNKKVSIIGGGWNEKPFATPQGSWILPSSGFPNTCSLWRGAGTDKVTGRLFSNFGWGEFGGALGTPKGLHGIFVDASASASYYEQNFIMDHVYIANMAVGKSIKITTGAVATPGGIPDSSITNSKFMSFNADFLADHVTIGPQNTIGQNATADARNIGIEFSNCQGCTSTAIINNNISNFNGMVIIHGANTPIIRDNEMEMSAGFTNTLGSMIDLIGDVAVVEGAIITGNQLAQGSLVGDYVPIKIDNAISSQIYSNRLGLAKATPYDYVTLTASAAGTFMGYNRCSYANASSTVNDLACVLSSLGGANGFQYTPFGFSLSGSTSGRATLNTQAVAGTAVLLLPTTSGTLASSATSPLVLSATTGVLTCPTCATSGGASIPTIATGDILYGSAANTLSALADIATGNALITGGVGVAPVYGKIGISTHVSGLGTGIATFLGTPSSANFLAALTTSTGTGNVVFSAGPTFTGTITASAAIFSGSVTLPSPIINGLPTGTGVATANTVSTLVARDGSGNFSAGTITAALSGNATTATSATSATNATNSTNGTTVATSTNASFFPLFVASSTNSNQPFNLDTTLTYNPSTDTLTATNFAGNASTATSSTSTTNATNTAITDDTTTNATMFPTWVTANTGNLPQKTTSTKLSFNPSTGALTSTSFTGAGTGLTGTAASLTAGNVTTNANLTGAVTSSGNATSLGSFTSANLLSALTDETGTGVAVFGTTPTIATPVINGLPTGTGVATANTVSTLVARDASGNFSAGAGNFTSLTMAAGAGAFGAGNSATSGQLTTMLLNGGSAAGSYMAWQAGNVTYAFIGDRRAIVGSADDDLLIQTQSGDGIHLQTNGTNTDRFAISSAGVISMPTLGSDTATVDNTVCVSGTGVILKGSGTLGICLGTSSERYKHNIMSMGAGLAEIVKLNPKNFYYNKGFGDDGIRKQYGFIAEDVVKVLPNLIGLDENDKPNSVDMLAMVPIMVNAIKELKIENDNLRTCQSSWKCRIFGVR